ncbi:hypothetical protein [Azospirillum sp.]|uniref:hypothetical protein n=1 Tax=Azospirillum sp. TaxID=34012 RepID=UPI002D486B65|nr:hypothetical protein [Azospirillum sp.]HYD64149.1 hypothetical protein [Azospirillum sp.]
MKAWNEDRSDVPGDSATVASGQHRRFVAGGTLFVENRISPDEIAALVKRLPHTLDASQIGALRDGLNRVAAEYKAAVQRVAAGQVTNRPWTKEDQASLRQAVELAGALRKTLHTLSPEAVRILDGGAPGLSGWMPQIREAAEHIEATLSRVAAHAPKLSQTRTSEIAHEVAISRLINVWWRIFGREPTRSTNTDGFLWFAECVSELLGIKISRGQIESVMRRLQQEALVE